MAYDRYICFLGERNKTEKYKLGVGTEHEVVLEGSREMLLEDGGVGPGTGFDRIFREG